MKSSFWNKIIFSFPVQLLFLHVRKNLAILLVWIILITAIFGGIGRVYGVHLLFLDPEYLNQVGFWSFYIVGSSLGILIVSFFISTYILDSHKFRFIGLLKRPFSKFCLNNSIVPILAFIIYLVAIITFQLRNNQTHILEIVEYTVGLSCGMLVTVTILFLYFRYTNKDIVKYFAGNLDKRLRKSQLSRERMMDKWKEARQTTFRVDYYFDLALRFRKSIQVVDTSNRNTVLKIFDQNHFNSVILELIIIGVIIFMGEFLDNKYVQIPAGASAMLLFSIILMLVSAISYWFRGWGVSMMFALILIANLMSKSGLFQNVNAARGLDYEGDKAVYSINTLNEINTQENFLKDKKVIINVLNNWKSHQETQKPRIVFQCVSGGGQRAAYWTMHVIQQADRELGNNLMNNTFLITGASGGLIGAAYYRELYKRRWDGGDINLADSRYLDNIGKDNLNSVIFTLLVNDAFLKFRSYEFNGKEYQMDRGYIFEKRLSQNLEDILDKNLMEYHEDELNAHIPLMIISPTIANDARKLYISTFPLSFMNVSGLEDGPNAKMRGADFQRLFKDQSAASLHFMTALRMSASFPYITPTITLPSDPRIEIMDAGVSDNFGVSDALRFMFVFRNWIDTNTSGAVIMIVRDTRKTQPIESRSFPTLFDKIGNPISSVYDNMDNIQDINNDNRLEAANVWLKVPIEVVEFEYETYSIFPENFFITEMHEVNRKRFERASLSWHLTKKEKENIIANFGQPHNQLALEKLRALLGN